MGAKISVRNPRNGSIDYWIEPPNREQIAAKCAKLREAQIEWQQGGLVRRIEALQQWKESILSNQEKLMTALVTDTGRLSVSLLEFESFISSIDRWCRLAPELLVEDDKQTAFPLIRLQSQLVPYPLVGAISPWNFPLLLSTIDTIPALLAGCAVVVKPSKIAPRFVQPLLESLATIPLLGEVLTYLEGAGDTGDTLIEFVDLLCFTGSVATGKKVAEAAAKRFIPYFLELGGKDPAIVLESADLELATSAILWGSVVNTGQSCLSTERIYVAASIFEEFVKKLIKKAQRLNLAYPTLEAGEIGPIIAERQAAIIQEHLQDAIEQGAIIHCGGKIEALGGGLWCRPTVLTQVHHGMKVMVEENFGPLMPVMSFDSLEQAIALANDTIYGLSAAVFAGTPEDALAVAYHLDAGAISINDAALTAVIHEAEKNAFKFSGMGGSRMGAAALKRFVRKKAFLIKTEAVRDPWWFKNI
ncbi:MAG: aldehyde dehydrogenase family protein [Actinomycetota bacterium]